MAELVQILSKALSVVPKGLHDDILEYLTRASGVAIKNAKDVIAYAKADRTKACLVAETIVRHAGDSWGIIDALESTGDNNSRSLAASLGRLLANKKDANQARLTGVGATVDDMSRDLLRQQLGRALVRQFGSLEQAEQVQLGLATLKKSDFEWLRTIGLGRA